MPDTLESFFEVVIQSSQEIFEENQDSVEYRITDDIDEHDSSKLARLFWHKMVIAIKEVNKNARPVSEFTMPIFATILWLIYPFNYILQTKIPKQEPARS